MSGKPILEIAANSLASALAAQQGGASRIELCTALELGGLTPSPAQIALVRERLSIPVHVLVRPRAGDFAYTEEEHATMLADIAYCAAAGCDGVVIGALCVLDPAPRELSLDHREALRVLAGQVVAQLELRRHRRQESESSGEKLLLEVAGLSQPKEPSDG